MNYTHASETNKAWLIARAEGLGYEGSHRKADIVQYLDEQHNTALYLLEAWHSGVELDELYYDERNFKFIGDYHDILLLEYYWNIDRLRLAMGKDTVVVSNGELLVLDQLNEYLDYTVPLEF